MQWRPTSKAAREQINGIPKEFVGVELDAPVNDENDSVFSDIVFTSNVSSYNPEDDYSKRDTEEVLVTLLKGVLNEREFKILFKRIWKGETFEEIRSEFEVSRERVRQIFNKALGKISNHKDIISLLQNTVSSSIKSEDPLDIMFEDVEGVEKLGYAVILGVLTTFPVVILDIMLMQSLKFAGVGKEVIWPFMLFISGPIIEEIGYRKIYLRHILIKAGHYAEDSAVILSSIIFAFMHPFIYGKFFIPYLHFFFGLSAGMLYVNTETILYPILLHAFWNAIAFYYITFGLPLCEF